MKMVLFDLGKTLEQDDVVLPGALETLQALAALRAGSRPAVLLALVSDFDMPHNPAEIPAIQQRYYAILETLGIRGFFEPVAKRVTLSTEAGVFKPDRAIFRAAVRKAGHQLRFADVLFVTENRVHVLAARSLGMRALHFQGPGETTGDVVKLVDLVPLVRAFAGLPAAPDQRGAGWVQLGDDLLVFGPEDAAERLSARAGGAGQPRARRTDVTPERLHLVIQTGRLFQEEHPDVPVIADKGRYLVVDLDPERVAAIGAPEQPCYTIEPLPRDTVVLDAHPAAATARAPLAWVQALVDSLARASFEEDLRALAAFRTRLSTGAEFAAAVASAKTKLAAMGYSVSTRAITVGGAPSMNLIAERRGAGPAPRKVVLVTAHLDSINIAGGPAGTAPGADDNGSGSAGLLAIARALKDHRGVQDLRLILFGGEEQGLHGSGQYVAGLSVAQRQRLSAIVNMDMIATLNVPAPSVLLEGATVSQPVIDGLAASAATYTTLAVQTSLAAANSDHVPFIRKGLPAVLTIEGSDSANIHIHSANDTLAHINFDLALDILRMNVAFVAQALGKV